MMEGRFQVYNELSHIAFILTVSSDFYSSDGYIKRIQNFRRVCYGLFSFHSLLQYIHLFQLR